MMLHLNIDSMIECLEALQLERMHAENFLETMTSPTVDIPQEKLRARIDRLRNACRVLADKLMEAVEEMD